MMALFVIFFIKCSDKITKNLLNKNDKSQLFTKQTHTKSKPHFLWILKPNWIDYGGPYQIAEMKTKYVRYNINGPMIIIIIIITINNNNSTKNGNISWSDLGV